MAEAKPAQSSRPPLATSISFPVSSSSSTSSLPLPFKRSLTTTTDLFPTAASSFHPVLPQKTRLAHFPRSNLRNEHTPSFSVGMDPSGNDPNVIFIHPPFTTFPGSENHPEGLTFNLLAENPEWFLDSNDFVSYEDPTVLNPNAIAYPPSLEPPRGWCPARKKDLKVRGPDGWPEGEEPRLRCTFCRRTYAGVNAKSMWRRHVFEKHKIAMANRREGASERPRGRGSSTTKENRQPPKHDSIVNISVLPQSLPRESSQRSRYRSSVESSKSCEDNSDQQFECDTPIDTSLPEEESSAPAGEEKTLASVPPLTPPLTPHVSSDSVTGSDESQLASPPVSQIPPSPYDPTATPSFRHCSPRNPSEQPWLFPSPSHPFSQARDLSLSFLGRDMDSKSLDSPLLAFGKKSTSLKRGFRSPLTTLETPESNVKARRVFPRFQLSSTFADSPLSRSVGSGLHKKTLSELSDDWPLVDTSPVPLDPFVAPLDDQMPAISTPAESPIVRRAAALQGDPGVGIGLLAPFNLHRGLPHAPEDTPISSDIDDEAGVDALAEDHSESSSPLPKRRKVH